MIVARRSFWRDGGGGVSILGAFALPVLIGFVALVAEYGSGLVQQMENQRTADLAAFVAATYYTTNGPGATALAKATTLAQNVAVLNGVAAGNVQVQLVTSPGNASSQAINVNIATSAKLIVATIIGAASTLNTYGRSYSQLGAAVSPCVVALSGSGGVAMSGSAALTAASCGVATNATLSVPCGTSVTATGVSYGGTTPSQPCSGIVASLSNAAITDPLVSNSGVVAAEAHLSSVATLAAPSAPTVTANTSGTYVSLNLQYYPTTPQSSGGCAATFSNGNTWTVSCPAGTYNFSGINIGGGLNLNFNTTGSPSSVYNFNTPIETGATMVIGPGTYNFDQIVLASGTTTFGAGTYNFAQGFITLGGATTTFGAGAFNFAQGVITLGGTTTNFGAGTYEIGPTGMNAFLFGGCNGAETFSICNNGSLSFTGNGAFTISNGVFSAGGTSLVLGSGSSNSYRIGPSTQGNAIYLGGGATMSMGAASLFQLSGNVNVTSGGGCITIGAAAQHDINGYFSTTGGTTLGAGVYTLNGYFAAGANTGGSVTCNGSTVGVLATGVTIVFNTPMFGGSCNNFGFCVGNGYTPFTLTAPTTGTTANFAIIGPQSGNAAGVMFTGGAGDTTLSGAVYAPTGKFAISGGAAIVTGAGSCLQIVASTIALAYGTTTASTCIATSGTSTSVSMVQ